MNKKPGKEEIRPEAVLRTALENVIKKWAEERNYFYAWDQLKSIRKELTVSR